MKRYQNTMILTLSLSLALAMTARGQDTVRNLALNRAAYTASAADYINTGHMATDGHDDTRWRSLGGHRRGDEQPWIYVDLGAECEIQKIVLKWEALYPKKYRVAVSSAAPSPDTGFVEEWKEVQGTDNSKGGTEELKLNTPAKGRYVRMAAAEQDQGLPEGIGLTEFEVWGTGGPVVKAAPLPPPAKDGTWNLCGGWRLCSQKYVADEPARVATSGYNDTEWLPATVPGTILRTYFDNGAIPDPWYADQNSMISDWFCRTSWWYRTELEMPESYHGKRIWLNFDGINYKADIYLNGKEVGRMAGAFIRGRFDITDKVVSGRNTIAVLIHTIPIVREPFDKRLDKVWTAESAIGNAPTFLVAAGWDWMPCMRDRNLGIWQKVFLNTTADVDLLDPYVITKLPLPDTSRADLTVKTELRNSSDREVQGILRGKLGDALFTKKVTVGPKQTITVTVDHTEQPSLSLRNPRLWWPNGYGEQFLYDFTIRFETADGKVSDTKTSRVGIREWGYHKETPLIILCNGQKIMCKGTNWCMDEGMLRLEREDFRDRLKMEKDMNFTMLRSTLGLITKPDFYDLCDEYGLMIWDDFGANHEHAVMSPDLVVENARDRVRRFRNHASVALWCGANEHGPHGSMEPGMKEAVEKLDGTRWFIPNSILNPPMDGNGPYTYCGPQYFFGSAKGFKSEIGLKALPVVESIRRMMPKRDLWPITQHGWGAHEWVNAGGNAGWCGDTEKAIARLGQYNSIEEFCGKAQLVSLEWAKAIFEAWNDKLWNDCSGVKIWMSNPVWPCLTFGIYDYYLEPTGGYFGCKKACEPIHIQWNIKSGEVKVINNTLTPLNGVTAESRIYQLDGREYARQTATVNCPANTATKCYDLTAADSERTRSKDDLSKVYFIRLELKDDKGKLLSDNFYWQSRSAGEYEQLNNLPKVKLAGAVSQSRTTDGCKVTVNLRNDSKAIAFATRLKLVDVATGLLVPAVLYSDNYVSLLPGEIKQVTLEFTARNVVGGEVAVQVEGWNIIPAELGRVK
ncbi:MAG: discoidin domain-containing protein [Verrucomicrobiota bacterium]